MTIVSSVRVGGPVHIDASHVTPDPNAESHAGHHPDLKLRVVFGTTPNGWHYSFRGGLWKGPYSTSEAAYDGFHDYMGWVRMDKVQP